MKEEVISQFASKSGISEHLSQKIKSLTRFLEQIITEKEDQALMDDLAELPVMAAKAFDEQDDEAFQKIEKIIKEYSTERITKLLRFYTVYFHLVNSLEQHEITRINRERAFKTTPEAPRPESIADAIYHLKEQGYSYEQALETIGKLDIQPTITAHPTEARRHSVLMKQQHITAMISRLEDEEFTPDERSIVLMEILNEINLLLATDEVRTEKVTVEDEVENGMFYFMNSIWETIPVLYEDLRQAFKTYYGEAPSDLPTVVKYRSWIGSDRDGNPNVTEEVTWDTVLEQRENIIQRYLEELNELRRYLSVSENQFVISNALKQSIEEDEKEFPLSKRYNRLYSSEPYRRKITHVMEKLRHQSKTLKEQDKSTLIATADKYRTDDFLNDLQMIADSLKENGLEQVADFGKLHDLIIRARTFGLNIASLDIRQHSRLHEETIAELLEHAQVEDNYPELSEEEKVELLTRELSNPRPLCPIRSSISEDSRKIMDVFRLIRDMQALDPQSFGSYIISMTHGVSDMLEVLILAKEAGLWSLDKGQVQSSIDVVPLFETIEDLDTCDDSMIQIYENRLYKQQLQARNGFQEIMLGYSDSNKDGGYWMANWALEKAQQKLGKVCRKYDIDFRLFHGRGGTVGRGGGRSNQAILALPPISNNGRIRFTEQGEVISFRYSLAPITRRHLEQIVNAMIRVTISEKMVDQVDEEAFNKVMNVIANQSMQTYRNLIDDENFWEWYTDITPIEHISRLPIASRPVSRKGGKAADFENLRAIPWVFAWTQVRYNVPGWFGIGAILHQMIESEDKLSTFRSWYKDWIFFKTILDNAQREMARTHLPTAAVYNDGSNEKFNELIVSEYKKAEEAILKITEQDHILDNSKVIRNSIRFRNPFTYPLNLTQVELLNRWRDMEDVEKDTLRDALFLSINGIAAAMQSTG